MKPQSCKGRRYRQSRTPDEYLNQRIEKSGECWEWLWGKDKDGYGQCHGSKVAKDVGVTRAHQIAYVAWVGKIPEGYMVCHTCDNPSCCNPAHLFLGLNVDNMLDMVLKGRSRNGAVRNPHYDEIVVAHGRESCTVVAQQFGVSYGRICQIWRENGLTGMGFGRTGRRLV